MAKEVVILVPKSGRADEGKTIPGRGRWMAGNAGDRILVTYQKRWAAGRGPVAPTEVRGSDRVVPGGR